MIQRIRVFVLLAGFAVSGASSFQGDAQGAQSRSTQDHTTQDHTTQDHTAQDHTAWVAEALQRMLTVKPGMTRGDLLKVFTTEGGISSPWERTYVSRDCRYFKVDVKFQPVGERVTAEEDNRDVIGSISRPYLQFSHGD